MFVCTGFDGAADNKLMVVFTYCYFRISAEIEISQDFVNIRRDFVNIRRDFVNNRRDFVNFSVSPH